MINILNCSTDISDFIQIINIKKKEISKILNHEKQIILLDEIFDSKKIFSKPLDKSFYHCLYDIKIYEQQYKTKLFCFIYLPKLNKIEENYRKLFFLLFYSFKIPGEELLKLLEKNEEFYFLLSTSTKDCRNIQELAGEVHGGNNQNFISIEELLALEKLVEVIENIKELNIKKPNIKEFHQKDSQKEYLNLYEGVYYDRLNPITGLPYYVKETEEVAA